MIDEEGKLRRIYPPIDYWSGPQEEVQVPVVAGTLAMPDVVVTKIPPGATVVMAVAIFKFRVVENTNVGAVNALDGATVAATSQVIQVRVAAGAWTDAINFVNTQFSLAIATRENGDVCLGSIDVSGAGFVAGNATYNIRWLLAKALVAVLNFNDAQAGLRIWYSL